MAEISISGVTPARMNLLSRFIGVITSPKATFQSVVAHPRWFGMLALACIASAILVGGFLFTKVGQEAWIDAALSSPWSGASGDNEQQIAGLERMAPYAGYLGIAQMLIFIPIFYLIVSAIIFAVFNAAMGGDASFKQIYSVVVHTAPIGVLGQLFTMPLNYARGTLTSATNLAVLLPMIDEKSVIGRLLGMIDLFLIWQVIVLAIGLAVLYKRRTQPIAIGLLATYGVIAVVVAVLMSSFGGSN
jgi:hypothetical protein